MKMELLGDESSSSSSSSSNDAPLSTVHSSSSSEQELFPINSDQPWQFQPNFIFDTIYSGILGAVYNKDLEKIENMVKNGSSVNINDNAGYTPLHLAVASDVPEIIDYLLQQEEIMVNARTFSGNTPLLCAVDRGKEYFVEKLLAAGACPNLPNLLEVSPLHLAVGKPNIVHLLIENGAKVDVVDYGGETPLHEAVGHNCIETVCMLLYYNADPNVTCHNNITPFMKAIILGMQEIQNILLEYVDDFNVVAGGGISTLSLAIIHNSSYTRDIIDRGADVNYQHPVWNAFEMACQQQSPEDFALIWKNLVYQELSQGRDFWNMVCEVDITKKSPVFLEIVTESGNVKPFLGKSTFIPSLEFLRHIPNNERTLWKETITKLVFVFLCEGAELSSDNMNDIYYVFRYCWLFEMLLYQDIKIISAMNRLGLANLIYDCNFTVRQHLDMQLSNCMLLNSDENEEFFHRHLAEYAKYVNSYYCCFNNNDWHLQYTPSLLEMARNKTREHLIQKFKLFTSGKFYSFLKQFPINQVLKDILSFKTPIYAPRQNCTFYRYV